MTLREHIERYIVHQNPICTPSAAQDLFTLAIGIELSKGGGGMIDWDAEHNGGSFDINHYYIAYFVKTVQTVLGEFAHSTVFFFNYDRLYSNGSPGITGKLHLSAIRLYVTPADLGYQCASPDSGKVSILNLQGAVEGIKTLCGSKEGSVDVKPYKIGESFVQMEDTRQVVYSFTVVIETSLLAAFISILETSYIFDHLPTLLSRLGILHVFEKLLSPLEPCEL